jgi:2-dehydropantoate 2-reductase
MSSILIEGIGGIGGVLAAKMIEAGYAPVLLTHNPAITEAIQRDGLRVTTPEGSTTVRAEHVYTALEDVPLGDFEAAYLLMKADGVVQAAQRTVPLLAPDGYVVTFQNGIVEDAVCEAIGSARVVSGIIGWGGTMHAPGVYEKTSGGETHIGEMDGRISGRVEQLAKALQTAAPVVVSTNMRGVLWSKLAINCTITTLGALTGQTLGDMLDDERVRRLFLRVYSEVIDTAEAYGVRLERIAAPPKLLYAAPDSNALVLFVKDLLVRLIGRRYRKLKSSMLQSLERGRKTEIDYLNAYVVKQAELKGLAAPANAALVKLIKEIERKARKIAPENIEALLQAAG